MTQSTTLIEDAANWVLWIKKNSRNLFAFFTRTGGLVESRSLQIHIIKQFAFTENHHSTMLHLALHVLYFHTPSPSFTSFQATVNTTMHASAANSSAKHCDIGLSTYCISESCATFQKLLSQTTVINFRTVDFPSENDTRLDRLHSSSILWLWRYFPIRRPLSVA
jgi:hypothetical protein